MGERFLYGQGGSDGVSITQIDKNVEGVVSGKIITYTTIFENISDNIMIFIYVPTIDLGITLYQDRWFPQKAYYGADFSITGTINDDNTITINVKCQSPTESLPITAIYIK